MNAITAESPHLMFHSSNESMYQESYSHLLLFPPRAFVYGPPRVLSVIVRTEAEMQ